MFLNVKNVRFNVKNLHFNEIKAFRRKNTIKLKVKTLIFLLDTNCSTRFQIIRSMKRKKCVFR